MNTAVIYEGNSGSSPVNAALNFHRWAEVIFLQSFNRRLTWLARHLLAGWPELDHGELARLRRDDAPRHHGNDEIALARSLGVDQLGEAEPAHRGAHRRETLTDATLKTYRRDLERRLDSLLERSPRVEAGVKLAASIGRWKDCLFVFVTRRDVSPTNNVSERQLRPSVIFRKVTNGFRSVWGSAVYADICSVLATGALNGHTALAAIKACLAGRSMLNST